MYFQDCFISKWKQNHHLKTYMQSPAMTLMQLSCSCLSMLAQLVSQVSMSDSAPVGGAVSLSLWDFLQL